MGSAASVRIKERLTLSKHKKKKNNNQIKSNTEILEAVSKELSEEESAEENSEDTAEEAVSESAAAEAENSDADEAPAEEISEEVAESAEGSDASADEPSSPAVESSETAEDSDGAEEKAEDKSAEADERAEAAEKSGDAGSDDGSEGGVRKMAKVSRDALREQTENERIRREARHRRRVRQQVTAYLILILILALIGGGLFFGIRHIVNSSRERRAEEEARIAAEQQAQEAAQAEAQAQQEPEPVVHTVDELGPTPSEQLDDYIMAEIGQMSLQEKVQGIMFITPESITGVDRVVIAGDGTAAALSDFCPGGIVYSAKNVTSPDQIAEMLSKTLTLVNRPVFLATSETGLNESGLVGAGIVTGSMTPAEAAATGDVEQVVGVGVNIGAGLGSVGITVDFAPVADLAVTAGGVNANSSYGNDAAAITPYVTAMADGLLQSGVTPVYKYFPSLVASAQNPQYGRAVSDRSIEDFRSNEFQVWLSAINAGASMIQMSNVIYPSIDSDSLPSSLSEKCVTGVLRDELKYDGVIISGPLNDAAITSYYTAADSAVMALKAGCDMIFSSPDPRAAVQGIMDAVDTGVISEERINDALLRIYRIRYADMLEQYRAVYEAEAVSLGVDLTGVSY